MGKESFNYLRRYWMLAKQVRSDAWTEQARIIIVIVIVTVTVIVIVIGLHLRATLGFSSPAALDTFSQHRRTEIGLPNTSSLILAGLHALPSHGSSQRLLLQISKHAEHLYVELISFCARSHAA